MHKITRSNLKRRLSVSTRKKDTLTRASLQGMEYPKPASLSDAVNYAKNA